ncbi:hypothetical protein ACFWBH_03470 [Streptomyces sp. NPDC059999]|uniref:hypothetical protein n=1 Tax=Streptomyces sp. NPDC059999 TaxID=3347030 RepID=UPI0036CBAAB0
MDEEDPRVRDVLTLARAVADLRQEALFNFGEMTGVKLTAILGEMLVHSELPDGYLDTVRAVFAQPPGYAETYQAFEERPGAVLVLVREPGAGQAFTAHALLADLRSRTGARVGPLSFGGTNRFPVRKLPLDQNFGYLLELPSDEGKEEGQDSDRFEIAADFGATLTKIQYSLEKRSSRLVVLTTPEQWERIKHGAPPNVIPTLGRPDSKRVAAAWLAAEAPQLDAALWLDQPEIGDLLKGQGPSEVLQIVTLILNADRGKDIVTSTDPDQDEFTRRVMSVVQARRDWRKDLRSWHSDPERTSFHRNFLLVAALFSNAPVAHIYAKTSDLCAALEEGNLSLKGQQGPGVIEMIDVIQADLSDQDVIQFPKPGWDDAVLSYFWTDRPMARKPFLKWMAAAPVAKTTQFLETFTTDDRLLLANRVGAFAVRWAERHQKSEPLEEIAQAWCKDDALWPAAVSLVSAAALHPTLGRFIHEALLRWSKPRREGSLALQKLTVDVCAGEFGRRHTGKALRRLSHAAASPHREVQTALHSAVRNLWSDPAVRQTLFDEVITWCAKDPKRIQAGRHAFDALATLTTVEEPRVPVLLPSLKEDSETEPTVADLAKGWRTLLDPEADDERTAEALGLWMDTAWLHPDRRQTIFEILRGAVDVPGRAGGTHPRHRLRDLLYRWQPVPAPDADPERVRLRHELSDLLDHDRGLAVAQYHRRGTVADGQAQER